MFCKYCGTKLMDEAVFCHACGKATNEQPVQQPVEPVPPVQPVYPQPVPAPQPVYRQPVPAPQPVYQQPVPPVPPVQPMYQPPVPPVYPQPVQPVYQAPVQPVIQQPVRPVYDPAVAAKLEKQALTCGILGLSLSLLGVPGIIFSAIAGSKASALKKLTGQLSGKAKTGYGLGKAGKIVSIIMTVIWALTLPSLLTELLNSFYFDNPFEHFSF